MSSPALPRRDDEDQRSSADAQRPAAGPLRVRVHGDFVEWLAATGGSLAVTTYTSGKLLLASAPRGELTIRETKFARPMGMAVDGAQLALAIRERLLVFRREANHADSAPAIYALVESRATGKLNVHDVAFGRRGIHFANTRYNCVARPSERVSFRRVWTPPFITETVPQDRCHLNGLGMRDGEPAMITAFCATGRKGGWREADRFTSGVMVAVPGGETVARGLCMPHSPRRHEGAWWVCNSGEGTLCRLAEPGVCDPVASLPGFTRGLCFAAGRAIVGLSKIRPEHILDAPPVRDRHGELRAGVALVDLATGRETGSLEFVRGGNEVFETAFLPGIEHATIVAPTDPPPAE